MFLPMIAKTEFGYNSRLMSSYKEHLIHVWRSFGGTSILFSVFFISFLNKSKLILTCLIDSSEFDCIIYAWHTIVSY